MPVELVKEIIRKVGVEARTGSQGHDYSVPLIRELAKTERPLPEFVQETQMYFGFRGLAAPHKLENIAAILRKHEERLHSGGVYFHLSTGERPSRAKEAERMEFRLTLHTGQHEKEERSKLLARLNQLYDALSLWVEGRRLRRTTP